VCGSSRSPARASSRCSSASGQPGYVTYFADARRRAPSIVFIDEIDAIGQRRGGQVISSDERDQTLNQMLAEMDGFDAATGVVVMAATNRPEVLDPALLRPGRFDRQVMIPLPARDERRAILAVHSRGKPVAPNLDLDVVARATHGFSGADLANLVNEAAIFAVRAGRQIIQSRDFAEARDRILLGRRDSSNALLPDENAQCLFMRQAMLRWPRSPSCQPARPSA
jgi:cell division protease FtsH